jgi:hypothetical protein
MKNLNFTLKAAALSTLFFTVSLGFSQSLPINFEKSITTEDFEDFSGGTATVIDNPEDSGINTSSTVGEIVRNGGAEWAGSKIRLTSFLDFTTKNVITLIVYTTAPAGTKVTLKLEDTNYQDLGDPAEIVDVYTTVSNEWETLTFSFPQETTAFDYIVFMFDRDHLGNGSANSTFYFDDIKQTSWSEISLGIEKNKTNGLSVFPNPANSQWTIYSENTDINLVEVFDLQGKLMLNLNPDSPVAKINTSGLVKGIYFSKISTNSGTSTVRLVKK